MNLLRDINRSDYTDERVAYVIDDDESKWGRYTEAIRLMVEELVDSFHPSEPLSDNKKKTIQRK